MLCVNFQCCFHLDKPACGGCRIRWQREWSTGSCSSCHQHGSGGTSSDCGCSCCCGSRCSANQLTWWEAAHASSWWLPGRPTWSHLCSLQHVRPGLVMDGILTVVPTCFWYMAQPVALTSWLQVRTVCVLLTRPQCIGVTWPPTE